MAPGGGFGPPPDSSRNSQHPIDSRAALPVSIPRNSHIFQSLSVRLPAKSHILNNSPNIVVIHGVQ